MGGHSEERKSWPDADTIVHSAMNDQRAGDREMADHAAAGAVHLAVQMLNTVALTAAKRGLRVELVQGDTYPSPYPDSVTPFAMITSVVTRPRPLG